MYSNDKHENCCCHHKNVDTTIIYYAYGSKQFIGHTHNILCYVRYRYTFYGAFYGQIHIILEIDDSHIKPAITKDLFIIQFALFGL